MSREFVVTQDSIIGGIGESERRLFQGIFSSVIEILEPVDEATADPLEALVGWDQEISAPEDPALRRLLPDGVAENPEEALELRRLTERSVRQSKVGALRAASLMFDSEELRLSLAQAELLARALNDVRLVLAERLNLHSAEAVELLTEQLVEPAEAGEADSETNSEAESEEDVLGVIFRFASALHGALVHAMLRLRQTQQSDEHLGSSGREDEE
ncbi:DUF2017 family protein [Psychromicrobium lacuslunae]|uniref:DUF2017 family protein n=1 Tax=Psychromicrobium lacuslunae TaxID=1618207 RepID=UPI0005D3C9D9|nr:DUF2017 family protein [Psychromicrobium lacuslunae]